MESPTEIGWAFLYVAIKWGIIVYNLDLKPVN